MKQLFTHARLVSPGWTRTDATLAVENGWIAAPFPAAEAEEIIDLGGALLLPGFFDVHFHGCGGGDFSDGTLEAVRTVAREKLRQGVTTFLGTTLTLPEAELVSALEAGREYMRAPDGAELAGIHLEGPFFAPESAGAQNPAYLQTPDIGLVDRLDAICPVRKVSYSPELDLEFRFLAALVERGILPSAAHTGADYELFCAAADRGLRGLTHFCNCMTPLHHLRFGLVGGGLSRNDVALELICDGVHLIPKMVEFIFRVAGCGRIQLITDSMRAAGMPDGEYTLGALPVVVEHRRARLKTGQVAGSTLAFHEGLRHVKEWTGLPLEELVRTTAWNQAESLGIPGIGKLEPGFRANLVRLSDDLEPEAAWIDGTLKWSKEE